MCFCRYLIVIKFDIVCLSETWVKEGDYIDIFFPNQFLFNFSRCDRRGGGVAINVSKKCKCSIMPDLVINEAAIECVFVKVFSEHSNMYKEFVIVLQVIIQPYFKLF